MAFPRVPAVSKGKINQAGQIIADKKPHTLQETKDALNIVSQWRTCHAYPINTFQSTLRDKTSKYLKPIVAQRLKRLPTIIDKLQRHPKMQLARMQDIGGVRAVVNTVKDVRKLEKDYLKSRFLHTLVNQKDYIAEPRDRDGYRSVHLIYRYKNPRGAGKEYEGLLIELQIRSRLQHTWATAVETMDSLLGQALKSGKGEQEWQEFFALVSSAFAYLENAPRVPRFSHLSQKETFTNVARAEAELQVLQKIKQYSFAMDVILNNEDRKMWSYHLIILDSLKKKIRIRSYGRDQLRIATDDYAEQEANATAGEKIDSVLVSAGPIEQLKRAYPNYFLDVTDFVSQVESIIKKTNEISL